MNLGDIVRDVWIDPSYNQRGRVEGWDIVHDVSRKITPNSPVRVEGNEQYRTYSVLN